RSSGDQSTLCVDGWLQVVQERGHHDCRHRARPSYSQGAILFRSWPSAPWLVAQSGMGDGTRIRERLETQKTSARPKYPALHQSLSALGTVTPISRYSPVPHDSRTERYHLRQVRRSSGVSHRRFAAIALQTS